MLTEAGDGGIGAGPQGSRYDARRAAVLGSPVAHSLSPAMHRAAYAHLGLDAWSYDRQECREPELASFLAGLGPEWVGLSLTMPLKEVALRLAVTTDAVARQVGAANTLVRRADGAWDAHNTDVHGVRAALADHGITSAGRALVLGSGATARSALVALGGLGVGEVTFVVRDAVRPDTAALAEELGLTCRSRRLEEVARAVRDVDLVVDTLPGRAADAVAAVLVGSLGLPPLFEAIYEGWPTALARCFLAAGAPVVPGVDMLAHQARGQVRLMTGRDVPVRVLLDAAHDALG